MPFQRHFFKKIKIRCGRAKSVCSPQFQRHWSTQYRRTSQIKVGELNYVVEFV